MNQGALTYWDKSYHLAPLQGVLMLFKGQKLAIAIELKQIEQWLLNGNPLLLGVGGSNGPV